MIGLELWKFVTDQLGRGDAVALMIVVDSQGSSPGRRGFKMAVARDGRMVGSIGGGIMEHKLVEMAIDRLAKGQHFWELKRQIHSKEVAQHQSGMICSGEQTIALLRLTPEMRDTVLSIIAQLEGGQKLKLTVDESGLRIDDVGNIIAPMAFLSEASTSWSYQEWLGTRDIAHVIGAGHVGLAMCKILAGLNFTVINYDDRPDLNTMQANVYAHQKIITPYPDLHSYIQEGPDVYVVIMTFGYRGDDEAIRALRGMKFKYIGMMGSESKIQKMIADLIRDGFPETALAALKAPAGLIPHCKTPAEIALSIAAEMIATRNLAKETNPPK